MVIPALACGVADVDLQAGAEIICSVIADYEPRILQDVRFIAYAEPEYETVKAVSDRVRSRA